MREIMLPKPDSSPVRLDWWPTGVFFSNCPKLARLRRPDAHSGSIAHTLDSSMRAERFTAQDGRHLWLGDCERVDIPSGVVNTAGSP